MPRRNIYRDSRTESIEFVSSNIIMGSAWLMALIDPPELATVSDTVFIMVVQASTAFPLLGVAFISTL